MRSNPRPQPHIKLNSRLHNFGQYDEVRNVISFGCRCDSEDDAIKVLLHELAHHDTVMFMTREEIQAMDMPDHTKGFEAYCNWIPEKLSLEAEGFLIG